jgi:predicted site-specific integrase-resolvase
MNITHLNQHDLAKRWSISYRTLERWRWEGIGPAYLKIGGRVVYRLEDIEEFEFINKHETIAKQAQLEQPILAGGATC